MQAAAPLCAFASILVTLALLLRQPYHHAVLAGGRPARLEPTDASHPPTARKPAAERANAAAHRAPSLRGVRLGLVDWRPAPSPSDLDLWCEPLRGALRQDDRRLRVQTSALLVRTGRGTNASRRHCLSGCSGRGRCDQLLGRCVCRHGYAGDACEHLTPQRCNDPRPSCSGSAQCHEWTRLISRCSGQCDVTSNRCTCGPRAKYPMRPLFKCEWEGVQHVFKWRSPGWADFRVVKPWQIWSWPRTTPPEFERKLGKARLQQLWRNIPRTWIPELAWCDMPREKARQAMMVNPRAPRCACYEDQAGYSCDLPVRSFCLNQCSGHGECRRAFCACDLGWTGSDCSIPIAQPELVRASDGDRQAWQVWRRAPHAAANQSVAQALRPSIFVYELPTQFNNWLLETRMHPNDCAYRRYHTDRGSNQTLWDDYAFGMEMAVHELLLASPHRTLNPETADFFFVPIYGGCYISRFFRPTAIHNLFFRIPDDWQACRPLTPAPVRGNEHYRAALRWIQEEYPFWRRKNGADHIFAFPHDEGACVAPIEMQNAIFLTSWGRLESPPKNATTVMAEHSWYVPEKVQNMYASRTCYDPAKDILMPVFTKVDILRHVPFLHPKSQPERKILFSWRGQHLPQFPNYSMGIRHQVVELWGDKAEWRRQGVFVSPRHSSSYFEELKSSTFCGVFPGNGWGHLELPIMLGCIPVVVQDEILVPFENVLNFSLFAIRLRRKDLPRLPEILRTIPSERVKQLQHGLSRVWERFTYSSLGLLERHGNCVTTGHGGMDHGCPPSALGAKRGFATSGDIDFWANPLIRGTDALDTMLQVLKSRIMFDNPKPRKNVRLAYWDG
ncbi:hypothetical protein AB1Y20_018119 [Prymnesium parvum]|uniref:EGF-like domain-containing protein n=1 Tax=Prymnesium parvum TaxID=97485 RepID=A0AB34JR62_PRYPA